MAIHTRIPPYPRITPMSQPLFTSLTSRAMMKGMVHSINTSPLTSRGVAMEALLYSLILFANCLTIFLFLSVKKEQWYPLDLRDNTARFFHYILLLSGKSICISHFTDASFPR